MDSRDPAQRSAQATASRAAWPLAQRPGGVGGKGGHQGAPRSAGKEELSKGFRRGFLGPHAFAAVTSYREAPESGSWAGASACTADDISLVGSMLDDKDNSAKIQALNALKALSGIRKFRLKIQEHSIKVLELISTIWDSELHVAGLRLLNNLPLPDFVHPQLRWVMPALMEILQSDYILAQVQAIQLLSCLAQKNDLLYDILNCQVHSNFLNLLQCTQPGSLLFELLVFAERLSEGQNSPHYCAVRWHYSERSLHEALFGEDSRLADRLLALVIHPEEDVQIQACKVIVSLQCPPDVEVQPSACQPSHSFFNNGE
ncbi:armadillo repeat-containing protein 12 isoform X4 [Manis pentadactyla]|uniref:armadillo repeat-containing protein 12 isoform X4 n=1 Tax=Manis pentadactyla TaxID=143292 RepID=UPI00255C2F27|nr:armadillo repeat-containing protein 12 isoform X4 [Manis pentadactyla]